MGRGVLMVALVLLFLNGCGEQAAPGSAGSTGSTASPADSAQLAQGRYLLRAGGCRACHTRQGGQAYAGGRVVPTPFGNIYSPNITADDATGIGGWSRDDFWQALHQGKSRDGRLLYPAFPFDSFTRVRRADSDAMFAALQALSAVHRKNRPPELSFPYNQRKLLTAWRALYFDAGVYQDNPDKSDEWNRGAYLVEGIGHCKACHSPRNFLGASQAGRPLAGGFIAVQDWYAPSLHDGPGGGLHGWTRQDIVDLLKTGRSARGTAFGPMAEVVSQSLQYLHEADLEAIATYLLDQPRAPAVPAFAGVRPSPREAADLVSQGQKLYDKHCADCHGEDGAGKGGVYPPLAGNTALLGHPVNAIRAVLLGGFEPTTVANPRPYSMPPFAPHLDDREVAAVVSYLRASFGNQADAVSPRTGAKYRSTPVR